MEQVPIVVFVGPVLGIGLMIFWLVAGKRMMGSTGRRYSQFKLSNLAQSLGLHIVEGDPELNMIQAHTVHNMRGHDEKIGGRVRGVFDTAKTTRVCLRGAPYGRPTEFVFHSYTQHADRVVVGITRWFFECYLRVQVPADLPPFEIVSRASLGARYRGLTAKAEWGLPPQSFGDAELDKKLSLTCADPRLGPHLAPVVGSLTSNRYVHIQGGQGIIQSICDEEAVMYVVMDLHDTQAVLEHMANALAGPVRA